MRENFNWLKEESSNYLKFLIIENEAGPLVEFCKKELHLMIMLMDSIKMV